MVGWVGGDQKGSLILLNFRYSNRQDVLIPNMISKGVWPLDEKLQRLGLKF